MSLTGVHICSRLEVFNSFSVYSAASHFARSRIEKYRLPSAVVFKVGETHSWFFNLTFHQTISGGAVGNDVGLAHDARGLHSQRLEDALFEHIAIELAGDLVDQNAQRQVSQIAVFPFGARRKGQRDSLYNFEKISFGVVLAEVEVFRIVGEARRCGSKDGGQ